MHGQVKMTEMWKAMHYKNYPLNIGKLQPVSYGEFGDMYRQSPVKSPDIKTS